MRILRQKIFRCYKDPYGYGDAVYKERCGTDFSKALEKTKETALRYKREARKKILNQIGEEELYNRFLSRRSKDLSLTPEERAAAILEVEFKKSNFPIMTKSEESLINKIDWGKKYKNILDLKKKSKILVNNIKKGAL